MKSDQYYAFGPFCLDTLNRSLLRDGEPLPIQPKTYEVLLILVENSGRTVARDELMNAIWGLHVSEGVLNFQINQLRKALKDNVSNPQYIQTFPKRGFRFIAPVTLLSEESLKPPRLEPAIAAEVKEGEDHIITRKAFVNDERSVEPSTQSHGPNEIAIQPEKSDQDSKLFSDQSKNTKAFGGHLLYVLACCAIYAGLFAVGLVAEIAYEFDRYGETSLVVALAIYLWVFVSSLIGFAVIYKFTRKGRSLGLLSSFLIFLASATLLFAGACLFLPSVHITQARFQTYTAQAAYLKTIIYFLLLMPFFMLAPFHFVVAVQKEMESNDRMRVLKMLTGGSLIVYPRGNFYIKPWMLLIMLSIMIATAFFLHSNLFNNLIPSTYMNLFSILIYVRLILYFSLGLTCLTWYYQALNDIKYKCIGEEIYN